MKKMMFTVMAILVATQSKADGFKCEGLSTGIRIQVYNHTDAAAGTRKVAVMIVSDERVNSPNKTIAKFTDDYDNNTLAYLGRGLFQARVDLRYSESNRSGENIAGTKLGYLKTINLQVMAKNIPVKFGYTDAYYLSEEYKNGDIFPARISYVKRNGEVLEEKANCARYFAQARD